MKQILMLVIPEHTAEAPLETGNWNLSTFHLSVSPAIAASPVAVSVVITVFPCPSICPSIYLSGDRIPLRVSLLFHVIIIIITH
jgi:hypothetical protein